MPTPLTATSFFRSIEVTSTSPDADADLLLEVPLSFDAEITLLIIANGDSAAHEVSLQVFHEDDQFYSHLVRDKKVDGNSTYSPVKGDVLHLHPGDKILCYKKSGLIDVSISGLNHYNTMRKQFQ